MPVFQAVARWELMSQLRSFLKIGVITLYRGKPKLIQRVHTEFQLPVVLTTGSGMAIDTNIIELFTDSFDQDIGLTEGQAVYEWARFIDWNLAYEQFMEFDY